MRALGGRINHGAPSWSPSSPTSQVWDRRACPHGTLRYDRLAMEQLQGRTAVVTGAASGIGLAVAEAFVGAGMRVVMADVDEDTLRSHAARLADQGAEILALSADVADPDAVESVGAAAV